jgi:hypothetical protein
MGQSDASTGRRVLGRHALQRRNLWFIVLLEVSLFPIVSAIVLIITDGPVLALVSSTVLSPCVVPCLYAYMRIVRMPGTVMFDNAGVEVRTLLRTWRYPWRDIAAVQCALVPSKCSPSMRPVRALKFREGSLEHVLAKGMLVRLTGGAGRLPELDFDEMDILQAALATYQSTAKANGATVDEMGIMRMLLGRCPELGEIREFTKVGTLASIDLVDYEAAGSKVCEAIQSGDWAAASSTRQGTAGSDWVFWYVAERVNGQGTVVEIIHYIELYFNEESSVVRRLTPYDMDRCRPYVTDWVLLADDLATKS